MTFEAVLTDLSKAFDCICYDLKKDHLNKDQEIKRITTSQSACYL